jgi:hypothetical protein
MDKKWKSTSSIRRAGLSILLGFSISFALVGPVFVLHAFGHPARVYQVVFVTVGLPLEILLRGVLPNWMKYTYFPCRAEAPELLGAFLTWSFFFSSMIYGYLFRRLPESCKTGGHEQQSGKQPIICRTLRIVAFAVLLLGMTFAYTVSILNTYRASGCDTEDPILFELLKEIPEVAAAQLCVPVLLIVCFFWIFRSGMIGNGLTLLIAIIFAVVTGHRAIQDILVGCSPCDCNSDIHLFLLLFFEMSILFLWILLYSISTLIESRYRKHYIPL